ncbi:hypothetical protein HaLaN_29414 [Haematococcus lacustris]|uniref:Uncharacterized protein n=1 Tax=Haematococcus lacustris TaxID=44745 RepID=A0A6A0ACF7_HAELA|nr:hypothetical protein HaLaN_29414 [Haematococcus lacustris]
MAQHHRLGRLLHQVGLNPSTSHHIASEDDSDDTDPECGPRGEEGGVVAVKREREHEALAGATPSAKPPRSKRDKLNGTTPAAIRAAAASRLAKSGSSSDDAEVADQPRRRGRRQPAASKAHRRIAGAKDSQRQARTTRRGTAAADSEVLAQAARMQALTLGAARQVAVKSEAVMAQATGAQDVVRVKDEPCS